MKTCKIEDCERPRVRGAFLCEVHLGEKRRCAAQVVLKDENDQPMLTDAGLPRSRQCKRTARPGTTLCSTHSGPKSKEIAERTEALTAMQRFVQPYQGDLDFVSAFEGEFRRTYSRILWLEERIAGLAEERDLIWGMSKEEHISASEFAGTNKTYEAKTHIYEDMLWKERKHMLEMVKLWVKAGIEEQKIGAIKRYMEFTYTKVNEAARALGHDPADPEVRERLMRLFADSN